MSDFELSGTPMRKLPSADAMEAALRREVAQQFDDDGKTVNTVREGAERSLGLKRGFFKENKIWKDKSKGIIKDEIELQSSLPESSARTVSANTSPAKLKVTAPAAKAAPKGRPSPSTEKPPKKRQKKSAPKEDSENDLSPPSTDDSKVETEPKAKKKKIQAKTKDKPPGKPSKRSQANGKPKAKKQESDSELSDVPTEDPVDDKSLNKPHKDSSSEMSVLIDDEEVQIKKKRQTKDDSKPKQAASSKPKKVNPSAEEDPDQEDIKRLQGWLVKCGVRKIWAFELKSYETPKAKIRHLKEMLTEVGMTGRYSLEKAGQIKEARELAADIEAVQEGNEIWGKDGEERSSRSKRSNYIEPGDEEEAADAGSKKQLVRGPKRYEFLSSDGDESD